MLFPRKHLVPSPTARSRLPLLWMKIALCSLSIVRLLSWSPVAAIHVVVERLRVSIVFLLRKQARLLRRRLLLILFPRKQLGPRKNSVPLLQVFPRKHLAIMLQVWRNVTIAPRPWFRVITI